MDSVLLPWLSEGEAAEAGWELSITPAWAQELAWLPSGCLTRSVSSQVPAKEAALLPEMIPCLSVLSVWLLLPARACVSVCTG